MHGKVALRAVAGAQFGEEVGSSCGGAHGGAVAGKIGGPSFINTACCVFSLAPAWVFSHT